MVSFSQSLEDIGVRDTEVRPLENWQPVTLDDELVSTTTMKITVHYIELFASPLLVSSAVKFLDDQSFVSTSRIRGF